MWCRLIFPTQANDLRDLLCANGCEVFINQALSSPRGSFVVTVEGALHPVLELLGLVSPFSLLRSLDIDTVAATILGQQSCVDEN